MFVLMDKVRVNDVHTIFVYNVCTYNEICEKRRKI